jgi:hypothetical protein
MVFQLCPVRKNERKILPLSSLTPRVSFPGKDKMTFTGRGAVPGKHSETGNNMPFQRHQCPGPVFWSKKGKNSHFSRNLLLEMPFLPFSLIFNTPSLTISPCP